jgi:RNA polymerase sigma-70 factor, ECF subfamily
MQTERTASTERDLMRVLHDEHAAALWAFAVGLTGGDRAAAEDVVQETLLRAWRNPHSPVFSERQDGSARGWLYTVARRIVIDEWRARSVRPEKLVSEVPESGVADHSERLVEARLVADALGRLTPEHRAVLVEMFYKRSTVRETALTLGIAEGTVKSRTHYALRAMRLALAEMGAGQ